MSALLVWQMATSVASWGLFVRDQEAVSTTSLSDLAVASNRKSLR